jgi:RNA polymerase sigma factor (sigma-70 family)
MPSPHDAWALDGDASVLARCLAGDESAWELVYGYLFVVARQACHGRVEAAEDLASDLALRLIRGGMRKVREAAALRGFLRKAVRHAAIDAGRSPRSREVSLDTPRAETGDDPGPVVEIADHGPSLEQGVLNDDVRRIIGEILADLSADCVKLLRAYLSYKTGWIDDYQELSRLLGRPIGSISVQVRRCLTRFRKDPRAAALQRDAG